VRGNRLGWTSPQAGNRKGGPAGRWRRGRDLWRDRRARHRRSGEDAARGRRLPAAHRRLPGEDLCRGPHSRRLFQARGTADREGDAGLRLIDRPIRPLFVDGWRNETQVIVTVLSHDMENDPDIVALVAA